MAIRKRRTRLAPAPSRRKATEERIAAGEAVQANGAWTTGGAIVGGIAGGAMGALTGNPLGIAAGAAAGIALGGKMGSDIAGSYASDANARAEAAQAALDTARQEEMIMMDMAMEQESREQAKRMSALSALSAQTPRNNSAGYKWGGYLR